MQERIQGVTKVAPLYKMAEKSYKECQVPLMPISSFHVSGNIYVTILKYTLSDVLSDQLAHPHSPF